MIIFINLQKSKLILVNSDLRILFQPLHYRVNKLAMILFQLRPILVSKTYKSLNHIQKQIKQYIAFNENNNVSIHNQ